MSIGITRGFSIFGQGFNSSRLPAPAMARCARLHRGKSTGRCGLGDAGVLGDRLVPRRQPRAGAGRHGSAAKRKSRYPSAQATAIEPISGARCGGSASSASSVRSTAALHAARSTRRAALVRRPLHLPAAARAASRMPSPIACNFSARQRAAPCAGNSGSASPQAVEVFADHRTVEQRQAVVGHQARHLRQRITRQQLAATRSGCTAPSRSAVDARGRWRRPCTLRAYGLAGE